jgi:hypothetical protein
VLRANLGLSLYREPKITALRYSTLFVNLSNQSVNARDPVADDEKAIEQTERDGWGGKEVQGGDRFPNGYAEEPTTAGTARDRAQIAPGTGSG